VSFTNSNTTPSLDYSIVAGNRLYFVAETPAAGSELWVSTGSPGAHLIRDIDPRTSGSDPQNLTPGVGGTYFSTNLGLYLYNESTRKVTWLVASTGDDVASTGDDVSLIRQLGAIEIIVSSTQIWRS